MLCLRKGFNSESWKLLGLVWRRAVAPLAVVVWAVVPWHGKTSLNHDYVKSKNLNQDGKSSFVCCVPSSVACGCLWSSDAASFGEELRLELSTA